MISLSVNNMLQHVGFRCFLTQIPSFLRLNGRRCALNNDGTVDIFDLRVMSAHFDQYDPTCELVGQTLSKGLSVFLAHAICMLKAHALYSILLRCVARRNLLKTQSLTRTGEEARESVREHAS